MYQMYEASLNASGINSALDYINKFNYKIVTTIETGSRIYFIIEKMVTEEPKKSNRKKGDE